MSLAETRHENAIAITLAGLPFAEQLGHLDAQLATGADVPSLLAGTAQLRDHEPLAYAVARVVEQGGLADVRVARTLRELLAVLPDTSVQRLLRRLDQSASLAPAARRSAAECAALALGDIGLERIGSVCLLDRWLRHTAPDLQQASCDAAFERCRAELTRGSLDALSDALLVRVSGERLAILAEQAAQLGREVLWNSRLGIFAGNVLDVLEAMPKSLSQANAEEILSRRVYTDPGHFLFELLQNADDAGASRFHVAIGDNSVSVWHDGAPFDARDVVGVLSIGQTTKRSGQIGFFGVGFKSVYEICERPQVYSGCFRFEIADVSIPRQLDAVPDGAPDGGTLVVLPFRDRADVLGFAAKIHARALAVPSQTLLTLSNVRELRVARGAGQRTIRATAGLEPGRIDLTHVESGTSESYLVASDRFTADHARERGRTAESPVLVAIALDDGGAPCALPDGAPTIFSYLPTAERSGLKFLLHAHFDVPVDRERLDAGSQWNRWAIGRAAEVLGRAVACLASEAQSGTTESLRRLEKLLDVLPLPSELLHESYAALLEGLRRRVGETAMLIAADGTRVAPTAAAIVMDPLLAPALGSLQLDAQGRRALAPLCERSSAVAAALGTKRFDAGALRALLEHELAGRPDGFSLGDYPVAAILDALGRLADHQDLAWVRALPLFPGASGGLFRAAAIARAGIDLRELYGVTRPFLDPGLDRAPGPDQSRLFAAVGLATIGPDDLVRDLHDARIADSIVAAAGAFALHSYLSRLPRTLTRGLGTLPLFPDESGMQRALAGTADRDAVVQLGPGGELEAFLRGMTGARPALIDARLGATQASFFRELGAVTLDLTALLSAIDAGNVRLSPGDLAPLHAVLDVTREDLTARTAERLTRAKIFPDVRETLRSLTGPARALRPADADVTRLVTDAPWLRADVAGLSYLRTLGIAAIDAAAVARAMLFEDDALLLDADDPAVLRSAHAYLATHPDGMTTALRERLATAKLWFDSNGGRWPLRELRGEARDTELAALYAAWNAFPRADAESASTASARAIGLETLLLIPGYDTMVRDLVSGPRLDLGDLAVRAALSSALRRAITEVAPGVLAGLASAPLFRSLDGRAMPLGTWDRPTESAVHRARGPVRAALAFGTIPLLHDEDEGDYVELLAALSVRTASCADLLHRLERDSILASPAGAEQARRALIAVRGELERAAPPTASGTVRRGNPRVEALALWPTTDGRLLPSVDVVRGTELRSQFGEDWTLAGSDSETPPRAQLDPGAESDAEALSGIVAFCSPIEYLVARLRAEARVGRALNEQPDWIASVARIVRAAGIIASTGTIDPSTLPLSVDIAGCLVTGARYAASDDEISLARGLPLFDELADLAWSRAIARIDPRMAPELPVRRLASALGEASRQSIAVADHALWRDPARRNALYRWLLASTERIEADPHTRALIARACCIPSHGAQLRAPRDLLLEPDLPDLGIDWNAADEVPAALQQWLRRAFDLDDARLIPLTGYLLDAYDSALQSRDAKRADEILGFLARSMRNAESIASLPKHLKLHRRLQLEATDGTLARPRELISPDPERWEWIEAFCATPPARLSSRYADDAVVAMLRAVGVRTALSAEELSALLDGRDLLPGDVAALALARYIAVRGLETPVLRTTLGLDRRRWIPDAAGSLRTPAELFWPTPEIEAVLGHAAASLLPHPEFVLTVPEALGQWLAFRRASSLSLADFVSRIDGISPAPVEVLEWLAHALSEGRLKPGDLRRQLANTRFIADEGGICRAPSELIGEDARELFGSRRGRWPAGGDRFRQLAHAFGISERLSPADVIAHCEQVGSELAARGAEAMLASEPDLLTSLPRCLAFLAMRNAAATGAMALVAEVPGAANTLCLLSDASVVLPIPEPEVTAARARADRSVRIAVLPIEASEPVLSMLARAGVPECGSPRRQPAAPPVRVQPALPNASTRLERAIAGSHAEPGLLGRFQRWFAGNGSSQDEPHARVASPPRDPASTKGLSPPHEHFMRPRASIDSQLGNTGDWQTDRKQPPAFGFAFAPGNLSSPHVYAPQLIADRFDRRTQRWTAESVASDWLRATELVLRHVALRGRIPAGHSLLPLPMSGTIAHVEPGRDIRVITDRDGRAVLDAARDSDFGYTVALHAPPVFAPAQMAFEVPRTLLTSTVSDDELPTEVHDVIAAIVGDGIAPLDAVTRVLGFIRDNYTYDPAQLEDGGVSRWLERASRGRSNAHVAALHAGRDRSWLGRGVCYELNSLACELLRRVGVPAAICVGWTFDRGEIADPDHLWAMALLASDSGPRWLPVDASLTRDGRPIHGWNRPRQGWKVAPPVANPKPDSTPRRPAIRQDPAPFSLEGNRAARRAAQREPVSTGRSPQSPSVRATSPADPTADLVRVARFVEQLTGERIGNEAELRERCRAILESPDTARPLLELLREAL